MRDTMEAPEGFTPLGSNLSILQSSVSATTSASSNAPNLDPMLLDGCPTEAHRQVHRRLSEDLATCTHRLDPKQHLGHDISSFFDTARQAPASCADDAGSYPWYEDRQTSTDRTAYLLSRRQQFVHPAAQSGNGSTAGS